VDALHRPGQLVAELDGFARWTASRQPVAKTGAYWFLPRTRQKEHDAPMAMNRRERREAEDRHRWSLRAWVAGGWILIALFLGATLLGSGALMLVNNLATTCSDYVPEFPNSPIDLGASSHQCHHFLGLEIPTQWNPALAIGFGLLAGTLSNAFEARTPPPDPEHD
jgi:ABC-type Fe3+ transport system permease subunit